MGKSIVELIMEKGVDFHGVCVCFSIIREAPAIFARASVLRSLYHFFVNAHCATFGCGCICAVLSARREEKKRVGWGMEGWSGGGVCRKWSPPKTAQCSNLLLLLPASGALFAPRFYGAYCKANTFCPVLMASLSLSAHYYHFPAR